MTIKLGESATPSNMQIYAIGDVHGYRNLLESMYEEIQADLNNLGSRDYRIIFLGDYIDRGPDSAGCVQFLIDLLSSNEHVLCLKGNHEDKLERFLAQPIDVADSFFTYGGVECAMSYGLDMTGFNYAKQQILDVCDQLKENLSNEHKAFYANLGKSVTFGDYMFAHAGVRPNVPLHEQNDNDLMCIRSEFITHTGLYDKVIVHGHTPAYPMEILPNRINVDTLAYDTGVLSCCVFEGTSYRVIEAR